MSASIKPMLTAVAFQMAAALESYQSEFDDMVRAWHDPAQCTGVNRRLDRIRMYAGAMPQLSGDVVEVLIAHVEAMQALWEATVSPSRTSFERTDHACAAVKRRVEGMRAKCLRLCVDA